MLTDARRSAAERDRIAHVLPAVLAEARRLHYDGPIPVAGYCAAATPIPGGWVGWSLCSAIPGLGTTTKGLGLEVYGARTLTGVAQFSDLGLRVHRRFGRMRIIAAILDLHPVAHTLVYRTDVFDDDEDQAPSFWIDGRDLDAQREMQAKIDAGTSQFYVLSPGLVDDRVPILELQLMPGRHYVLAFSGGLDTSYALAVLVDRGERVTTVTVNTGGFAPDELREIAARSRRSSAPPSTS